MLPGSMSKSLRAAVASIALYAALICGLKYLTLSETGSPACGQRQGRLGTRGTSHPTVTCSEAFMLIQAFDRPYKRVPRLGTSPSLPYKPVSASRIGELEKPDPDLRPIVEAHAVKTRHRGGVAT